MQDYDREYFHRIHDVSGEGAEITQVRGRMLLARDATIRQVLDIGCGLGDLLAFLESRGVEGVGVDISEYALKQARQRTTAKLHLVDVARQPLPFADESFDAIAAFDLIEHIPSPKRLFLEMWRVLRPNGWVFLTTPNNQGELGKVLAHLFPTDPTHINVQGSDYWRECLMDAGFDDLEIRGVILHGFPPMYAVRRWLERFGFPIVRRPIFFPLIALCGTLYIFARKPNIRRV